MAKEKYLLRRGNFWYVQIPVPKKLQKQFGKTRILESLGVSDIKLARIKREERLTVWRKTFERAKRGQAMTLEEIAAHGEEAYRLQLDKLKAAHERGKPHETILYPGCNEDMPEEAKIYTTEEALGLDAFEDALIDTLNNGGNLAEPEINAIARAEGLEEIGPPVYGQLKKAILTGWLDAVHDMQRLLDHKPPVHTPTPPRVETKSAKEILGPTFGEAVNVFLEATEASKRLKPPTVHLYHKRLEDYASALNDKPVKQIDSNDIVKVLAPMWGDMRESADRTRQIIAKVLDYAKVKGWREGENPAAWRGNLEHFPELPKDRAPVEHRVSLPYQDIPAFIKTLALNQSPSAKCLIFSILMASRPGESLGGTWDEIDLAAKVWIIPASRYKTKKKRFRTALSKQAIDILLSMPKRAGPLFPNENSGDRLSENAMRDLIDTMDIKTVPPDKTEPELITAHGTARAGFANWATAHNIQKGLADLALGHEPKDPVDRAYFTDDALEQRRPLMQQWADYCFSGNDLNP